MCAPASRQALQQQGGVGFVLMGVIAGDDRAGRNRQRIGMGGQGRGKTARPQPGAAAALRTRLCNSALEGKVDGTAFAVGVWILTGLLCRWAPYAQGHGPGQGQLPVSNIKAPGHR